MIEKNAYLQHNCNIQQRIHKIGVECSSYNIRIHTKKFTNFNHQNKNVNIFTFHKFGLILVKDVVSLPECHVYAARDEIM